LTDTDAGLRDKAAEALGELGDVRAVEPLIRSLWDNDTRVSNIAAYSLTRIGSSEALSAVQLWETERAQSGG